MFKVNVVVVELIKKSPDEANKSAALRFDGLNTTYGAELKAVANVTVQNTAPVVGSVSVVTVISPAKSVPVLIP